MKHNPIASVTALFARCSLFHILGLLLVSAGVQTVLFRCQLSRVLEVWAAMEYEVDLSRPEEIVDVCGMKPAFCITFLLLTLLLSMAGTSYSSRCGYTLSRLRISERGVFVCQALYNAAMYLLLLGTEVTVCVLVCRQYAGAVPAEYIGPQTTLLAFYRSTFLHALLPLSDIAPWIRNGFLLAALSMTAAEFPFLQRRGKVCGNLIGCVMLAVVFFVREIGDGFNTFLVVFFSLILAAEVIYHIFIKDEEETADDAQ
ncbi:MAG: hypothetical protein IJ302_02915 [Clostridia bacterium]|nr:hypothetical protein [Clostridia bacterium]